MNIVAAPRETLSEISLTNLADLTDALIITDAVDLGSAAIYLGSHPMMGVIAVVTTAFGRQALLRL